MDKTILYWLNEEKVFHEDERVPIQLFFKDHIVHELHTIENKVDKPWKISVLVTETAVGLRRQHFKANACMTDYFYTHSQYMHKNKSFIAYIF